MRLDLDQRVCYADKSTKSILSTLSDNAKQFVEMVNNGEIKQPVWKAGKNYKPIIIGTILVLSWVLIFGIIAGGRLSLK